MKSRNKRLIICCDGTWNNPEQKAVTNVVKTARAILPVDQNGIQQVVFYDWGVGSEGRGDKLSGGAMGDGLDKNIQDAYRFLVHNYAVGDEIYLFGFSRGAYTARSTVGFIRNTGILKKEHADRIPKAYRMYRSKAKPDAQKAVEFREQFSQEAHIKFIGAWDTVGALGIPLRIMHDINKRKYAFHDTSLSGIINHACHALAIDERRKDFEPALWTKQPEKNQIVEQVWFAGVHCDIGGGYKEKGLSDITLKWMLSRAETQGLAFDKDYLKEHIITNSLDKQHVSWKGFYWTKGRYQRPIGELAKELERIHPSVHKRYNGKANYRPRNLMKFLKRHSG